MGRVLDFFNADNVAVYQFALTKHGADLAALFRGFKGVVMCDAESRMNEIFRSEGINRANCNAYPASPVISRDLAAVRGSGGSRPADGSDAFFPGTTSGGSA